MSKTEDTKKTRELTEAELAAVSGGGTVSSALDGIFKAATTAAQKVG